MKPDETTPNKIGQFLREPVATLPACLCGLDTNPVASPRMDIHCPKHDAPEVGGESELWHREFTKWFDREDYGDREQLEQAWVAAIRWANTRISQPADEPSDEDEAWIRRLAQRIRHHQMKGYDMYTEDHLVASITDEYQKRRTVAQPSPATVPAFKNSKEAMLYAQRNNIPTVIAVSAALAEARRAGTPTTDAEVAYPCVVDHKTLIACLETAEQVFRKPNDPARMERFQRTKAKLFAQARSTPSEQKENSNAAK